jgi:hypothetical protein
MQAHAVVLRTSTILVLCVHCSGCASGTFARSGTEPYPNSGCVSCAASRLFPPGSGSGFAFDICCPPLDMCLRTTTDNPFGYGVRQVTSARGDVTLVPMCALNIAAANVGTLCRPMNVSLCQQDVFCDGSTEGCDRDAELESAVHVSSVFRVLGSAGVGPSTGLGGTIGIGAITYFGNASSVRLRVTGVQSGHWDSLTERVELGGCPDIPVSNYSVGVVGPWKGGGCATVVDTLVATWVPLPPGSSLTSIPLAPALRANMTGDGIYCMFVQVQAFKNTLQWRTSGRSRVVVRFNGT